MRCKGEHGAAVSLAGTRTACPNEAEPGPCVQPLCKTGGPCSASCLCAMDTHACNNGICQVCILPVGGLEYCPQMNTARKCRAKDGAKAWRQLWLHALLPAGAC